MNSAVQQQLKNQGLSNREIDVAAKVAEGLSNHEVAGKLFVTDKTVKFHLTNIFKKLGIRSRTQLAVLVMSQMNGEALPVAAPVEMISPPERSHDVATFGGPSLPRGSH